jgi:chromosome segregation ATPase
MDPANLTETPSTKEANQLAEIKALAGRLESMEKDAKEQSSELGQKAERIRRLETELMKLKETRTDDQLALEVKSLRLAVSAKDRNAVELTRAIEHLKDAEKVALNRAKDAERKTPALETTIGTMQKARDAAETRCTAAEQAFREAHSRANALEVDKKAAEELTKGIVVGLNKIVVLAEAIVKKSPSLNRNETEVKIFTAALEAARGAKA